LRILEPVWDTRWANWATNWEFQFARYSSRKPVLRQVLELVAGVRFELTTFGLWVDDQTLSPIDSVALTPMRPPKPRQKGQVLDPCWTLEWKTPELDVPHSARFQFRRSRISGNHHVKTQPRQWSPDRAVTSGFPTTGSLPPLI